MENEVSSAVARRVPGTCQDSGKKSRGPSCTSGAAGTFGFSDLLSRMRSEIQSRGTSARPVNIKKRGLTNHRRRKHLPKDRELPYLEVATGNQQRRLAIISDARLELQQVSGTLRRFIMQLLPSTGLLRTWSAPLHPNRSTRSNSYVRYMAVSRPFANVADCRFAR